MSCKYDNSMYTTIPKDLDEYNYSDIDEIVEEPIDNIDYSFNEKQVKELQHFEFLIIKYDTSNE